MGGGGGVVGWGANSNLYSHNLRSVLSEIWFLLFLLFHFFFINFILWKILV